MIKSSEGDLEPGKVAIVFRVLSLEAGALLAGKARYVWGLLIDAERPKVVQCWLINVWLQQGKSESGER